MTASTETIPRWRLWLSLLALAMPIQMTVTASPFLNGAAMDARGLDEGGIGAIRTAEILTNACLMIWLSANITRFRPRLLALLGASAYLAGNLVCLLTSDIVGLAVGRIPAGAGAGMMAAAIGALIAQSPAPHRVAALIAIPVTLAAIGTALGVGRLVGAIGEDGVFGLLCAGGATGLMLAFIATPDGKPHATHAPAFTSLFGALRHAYVLGAATIFVGSTAVWHFFERIGAGHGLTPQQIGDLSAGVGVLCGLLAPLAGFMRDAWVRWGFLAAVATFGLGSTLIPISGNVALYAGAFAAQSAGFAFFQILGASVAARLDRTGGMAAAATGWTALGNAFSPAIGGAIVATAGYAPLGALCAAASAVTVTLFFFATRKL